MKLFSVIAFTAISSVSAIHAYSAVIGTPSPPEFAVLAGYGSSHPGLGETETRVETVDLVLRGSSVLIDEVGASWYRGYHSLMVELPFHFFTDREEVPMIGLNFLATYTFTSLSFGQPYVFAGGGPLYIDADIEGMGADWNGNYQFGAGVNFPLQNGRAFLVEARYHHVSNAGSSDPNIPLNSTKFLLGFTF
ncbi:MAG: acyloxyacyl hydrolase [Desulfopila sp.]|jgi:hypothetical protein|nr:acyloxyacyl hydrolase [Desulfopila sp.]